MKIVEKGDRIKVHYTGKLNSGEVFDSSEGRDPLEFVAGAGQMIPGFDDGVLGMEENGKKTINIEALNAYGMHNPEYVYQVDRNNLPNHIEFKVGLPLQLSNPDGGHPISVLVTQTDEQTVTLDANHRLAGQDLTFDVQVVGILKGE